MLHTLLALALCISFFSDVMATANAAESPSDSTSKDLASDRSTIGATLNAGFVYGVSGFYRFGRSWQVGASYRAMLPYNDTNDSIKGGQTASGTRLKLEKLETRMRAFLLDATYYWEGSSFFTTFSVGQMRETSEFATKTTSPSGQKVYQVEGKVEGKAVVGGIVLGSQWRWDNGLIVGADWLGWMPGVHTHVESQSATGSGTNSEGSDALVKDTLSSAKKMHKAGVVVTPTLRVGFEI